MHWNKNAFTLIELLIVVAIIGILVSLAFPVISSVRKSAKKTAAKMDMQSIGRAVDQYYSEYRRLPITPDVHRARGSGTVTCSLTGLSVYADDSWNLDLPGGGWHHNPNARPPEGQREMAMLAIATLQGSNEYAGRQTGLNPRGTQFLRIQEGRPAGHFMDPWSKGFRIEDDPGNRQYGLLMDHDLNGVMKIAELWRVPGHDGVVEDRLIVVRCNGDNRRIDLQIGAANNDDMYSIDLNKILEHDS